MFNSSAIRLLAKYASLRDRTVLVTGGASGIGATLVEEFATQEASGFCRSKPSVLA